VVAVEVPHHQEGEGGMGRRGRVDEGGEVEEMDWGASTLRRKVDDGEEEGGTVLGTDDRADDRGGGGAVGEERGVDAVRVGEEGFDRAVRVVEEGNASSTDEVLTRRGGAGLVEVGPATGEGSGLGVAGFDKGVEEGGSGQGDRVVGRSH
jgi:hypothetical protein